MSIGIWQVILILLVVLIIFGAGKLPNVMGDLAKGVKNFKSGLREEDETAASEPPKVLRVDTSTTVDHTTVKKDETARS